MGIIGTTYAITEIGGSTFGLTKAQLGAHTHTHTHARPLWPNQAAFVVPAPRQPPHPLVSAPGIVNSIVTLLNGISAFKYATQEKKTRQRAAATSRLLVGSSGLTSSGSAAGSGCAARGSTAVH